MTYGTYILKNFRTLTLVGGVLVNVHVDRASDIARLPTLLACCQLSWRTRKRSAKLALMPNTNHSQSTFIKSYGKLVNPCKPGKPSVKASVNGKFVKGKFPCFSPPQITGGKSEFCSSSTRAVITFACAMPEHVPNLMQCEIQWNPYCRWLFDMIIHAF